jgi:hypothetical protein
MAGQTVIQQGQYNPTLYILMRGSLKVDGSKTASPTTGAGASFKSTGASFKSASPAAAAGGERRSRITFSGCDGDPSSNSSVSGVHASKRILRDAKKARTGGNRGSPASGPPSRLNTQALREMLLRERFEDRRSRSAIGMKEMSRFRILERPGAMFGLVDIDSGTVPFPFRVEATALCHMFVIQRKQLLTCFNKMTTMDEQACRGAIRMEHAKNVASLQKTLEQRKSIRVNLEGRFSRAFGLEDENEDDGDEEDKDGDKASGRVLDGAAATSAGSALHFDPSMPLITQVRLCAGALDRRVKFCNSELRDIRASTAVLPQLLQQLRGKAGWQGKHNRRGSVLNMESPPPRRAGRASLIPFRAPRGGARAGGEGGGNGGSSCTANRRGSTLGGLLHPGLFTGTGISRGATSTSPLAVRPASSVDRQEPQEVPPSALQQGATSATTIGFAQGKDTRGYGELLSKSISDLWAGPAPAKAPAGAIRPRVV